LSGTIARHIAQFIVEEVGWRGDPALLTDDFPIIDSEVLDSIGLLAVVAHLESKYGIAVEDIEIAPVNFGTLGGIDRYVTGKLGDDER
jgi:acyl carrier protein